MIDTYTFPTTGVPLLSHSPVTYSRMYGRIAAGFLIWKMLSDLRIIFSVRTAIRNIRNVHGKIKLLNFSVKALWILSVIDMEPWILSVIDMEPWATSMVHPAMCNWPLTESK